MPQKQAIGFKVASTANSNSPQARMQWALHAATGSRVELTVSCPAPLLRQRQTVDGCGSPPGVVMKGLAQSVATARLMGCIIHDLEARTGAKNSGVLSRASNLAILHQRAGRARSALPR